MRFSTLFNIGLVGSVLLTPAMAQDAKAVQDQAVEALRARISELRTQSTPVDARAARSARQRAEVKERTEARDKYQAEKRAAFEKAQRERNSSSKTRTTTDASTTVTNTVSPAYQSDLEQRARQLLQKRMADQPTSAAPKAPAANPPVAQRLDPLSPEQIAQAQSALRQQYNTPMPAAVPAPKPPAVAVSAPKAVVPQTKAAPAPAAVQQPLAPDQLSLAQRALREQYAPPAVATPVVQIPSLAPKPMPVAAAPQPQVQAAAVRPTEPALAPDQLSIAQKALREQYAAGSAPATPSAPVINHEAEAAAREALRRATAESAAKTAAATPSKPQATLAKSASAAIAPTAPAPKTKQEKLAELLNLYKADKITPGQYHQQRVKIVNEP